ncbi:MAG: NAD(P)-binding domain-containing protein [Pseudomonadota bacterium]
MQRVAVVGGGPAGLVAARFLKSEGFEPVLFEQGEGIGGQWSGDAQISGIWPTMHTNTSRVHTQFSDLPHAPGLAVYPSNLDIRDYLGRYADHFDLRSRTRLKCPVREIAKAGKGWVVRHGNDEEVFEKVVVASGRFHHPWTPNVRGLEEFSGSQGVSHAYAYKNPDRYRGKRVLVAGCAISALEIASDLCMLGAASVVVCHRRQRYVLPKLAGGVPSDHRMFTRYQALAEESLPHADYGRMLKGLVLAAAGSPDQVGAPQPADSIFDAGLTLCQHYLPMVAEGRIEVRPWFDRVEGDRVTFTDGHAASFDGILFGTGFELRLPFLSDAIRQVLNIDAQHIELFRRTFHPELPGLAFMGLWDQAGPYLPPLELQARWLAYVWSGAIAAPSRDEMQCGIVEYRANRSHSPKTKMNLVALSFARAAGVEPDLARWPQLQRALLFGPLAPVSFRLQGRDALPDAAQRFEAEARAFSCVTSTRLSRDEGEHLRQLAQARNDPGLAEMLVTLEDT